MSAALEHDSHLTSIEVELSRRYRFSASHRLHVEQASRECNVAWFGRCNNPFGHGHNYTLQVTLAGPVNDETGMVVPLGDLDAFVAREVLERFDHANLNHDPAFLRCVPSTENLAVELWRVMEPFAAQHPAVTLTRVRVEETSNNAFDYFGEGLTGPAK